MTRSAADDSESVTGPSTAGKAGESSRVGGSAANFRIRWDRVAIALVGATALVIALVTSVLAVVGLVASVVPVFALVLAIASVVTLRTLAVRGRRRTPQPDAGAPERIVRQEESDAPVVHRPTTLFNAEESEEAEDKNDDVQASASAPVQFTAAELRAAALAVAAEAGEKPAGTGTPWQPVEVPKPTYVEAPKADREDPAPLDLPEAPRPQAKTPIKNAAVAPKAETSVSAAPRMNLDEVLQRRRA
ncbi:hypothetical protein [Arthrobacter sp. D2-10]